MIRPLPRACWFGLHKWKFLRQKDEQSYLYRDEDDYLLPDKVFMRYVWEGCEKCLRERLTTTLMYDDAR